MSAFGLGGIVITAPTLRQACPCRACPRQLVGQTRSVPASSSCYAAAGKWPPRPCSCHTSPSPARVAPAAALASDNISHNISNGWHHARGVPASPTARRSARARLRPTLVAMVAGYRIGTFACNARKTLSSGGFCGTIHEDKSKSAIVCARGDWRGPGHTRSGSESAQPSERLQWPSPLSRERARPHGA